MSNPMPEPKHLPLPELAALTRKALAAVNLPCEVTIIDEPEERGVALGDCGNIVEIQADEAPAYLAVGYPGEGAYWESEPEADPREAVRMAVLGIVEDRLNAALGIGVDDATG